MAREACTIKYFKEIRVGVIVDDLAGKVNYQECSDDDFLTKAEEQGTVWTLQGFQKFIESGELLDFIQFVKHPNYLMVRFINIYEHDGVVYCDDEGISNPTTTYDNEVI